MKPRTEDEWNDLMNVLGAHAVALTIATQYLEAASGNATANDWLTLIMAKTKTEYESCSQDQLKAYLAQTLTAMGHPVIIL